MHLAAKFNQRIDDIFCFDIYYTQIINGVYHSALCGTFMITKSGKSQFLIATPMTNVELQDDFDTLGSSLFQMINCIP